jgi:hypothetical protein
LEGSNWQGLAANSTVVWAAGLFNDKSRLTFQRLEALRG